MKINHTRSISAKRATAAWRISIWCPVLIRDCLASADSSRVENESSSYTRDQRTRTEFVQFPDRIRPQTNSHFLGTVSSFVLPKTRKPLPNFRLVRFPRQFSVESSPNFAARPLSRFKAFRISFFPYVVTSHFRLLKRIDRKKQAVPTIEASPFVPAAIMTA